MENFFPFFGGGERVGRGWITTVINIDVIANFFTLEAKFVLINMPNLQMYHQRAILTGSL